MRRKNILADQVMGILPVFFKIRLIFPVADRGDVVDQSVEPDIADIILVERQLNSP